MPNYVKNKIMVGKKEFIDQIKKDHFRKDPSTGGYELDFDTIVKMPESLKIECGSRSYDGVKLYLAIKDPDCAYAGTKEDKMDKEEFNALTDKLKDSDMSPSRSADKEEYDFLSKHYKDKLNSVIELGKKSCENLMKHGACNWYEWSVKHWGTKWNASATEIADNGKSILFETAWDPALPAVLELSKKHPEMKIAFLYSDEDIGNHVGYALMTDGKIDFEGTFLDQSADAYKLAFDLWGCREDYRYDTKKKTYVHVGESLSPEME